MKNRNYGTTDSRHVGELERFWREQLAAALNVDANQVGPRRIAFRPYRTKSFDVCWPLTGEPKILISVKSMQNAYRNLTNRIEEAIGDSAVARLYGLQAAFGFFFFLLDGKVARGEAPQYKGADSRSPTKSGQGFSPYLAAIEEGGDYLQAPRVTQVTGRKISAEQSSKQDVVRMAEQSLLDLAAAVPLRESGIHYDAIGFCPAKIIRLKPTPRAPADWAVSVSPVDARLAVRIFIQRLIDAAKTRGLLDAVDR